MGFLCKIGPGRCPSTEMRLYTKINNCKGVYKEISRFYKDYVGDESSPIVSFRQFISGYILRVIVCRKTEDNQPGDIAGFYRQYKDPVVAERRVVTVLVLTWKLIST